jgi:hypothetical protein
MSDGRYVSIGGPADEIEQGYLTYAHNCIVIGTREDTIPQISVSEINEASAEVSRKYFISSVRSPEMIRLSELIGTEADMPTQAEMEDILTEVWSESLKDHRTWRYSLSPLNVAALLVYVQSVERIIYSTFHRFN